jgi:hypothetical protein
MKTKNKPTTGGKKQQTKKIIVASLAVGAAGILGYFGWQYLQRKKPAKGGVNADDLLKTVSPSIDYEAPSPTATLKPRPPKKSPRNTSATPSSDPGFPLKKGSKGEHVRLLQEALIEKYGKSILPKYGADGDFGSETINALKKIGLPAVINQSTFNVLTQGKKAGKSTLGSELYAAVVAKDFNKVISVLKSMNNTEDYSAANEVFKTYRLNGVRQTIVTGLLHTFTRTEQKEKIKFEFLRIGLQFDGNKWSLSGFEGKPIVTREATTVWVTGTTGVNVPAKMVLGNEVTRRLDYTLFENKGKYFLVTTKSIQYL